MSNSDWENLENRQLIQLLFDAVRRMILHYGMWFSEVQSQLGLEEAIQTENDIFPTVLSLSSKRFSQSLGMDIETDIPDFLLKMPKKNLLDLIDSVSLNWLADDGVWFQAIENRYDMDTAKRCNDVCWTRYSPLEANMIKSSLSIPNNGGLLALGTALAFRLYSRINKQTIKRKKQELVFTMDVCRVQEARRRKGLTYYPCKSAGLAEYSTFARAIDPRIKTECLYCPPDQHPEPMACAWRFYLS